MNKYRIISTNDSAYEVEARFISSDNDFIYFHGDNGLTGIAPVLNVIVVRQIFSVNSELSEHFGSTQDKIDK